MLGVTLAWGIDANASLRGLWLSIAFLAVPARGALEAIQQNRRERAPHGEAPVEEGAG
jgi:hypothetical protein